MATTETKYHALIDMEDTSERTAKKEEALGTNLQSNLISAIRKYTVERKNRANEEHKNEKKDVYFLFLHK